jgi:hypothetical protein
VELAHLGGGGVLLVLKGGASCLYKGYIYFSRHVALLKYFTYHLVPVLLRTRSGTYSRQLKLALFICLNKLRGVVFVSLLHFGLHGHLEGQYSIT